MPNKLKARFTELTFETSLFKSKNILLTNKQIQLDLSSIQWIDPFGLIYLRTLFHMLLKNKNELDIRFNPLDSSLINYIVRMNFASCFMGNNRIKFTPDIQSHRIRRRNLPERLIELKEFQVQNDDEVEKAVNRIIEIVSPKIDSYEKIRERFTICLAEIISNVQVHSNSNIAIVVLQTYGTSIIISIGDHGIGIKEGLKSHGIGLSDQDSIEKALEPGITGRDDLGGMGLAEVVYYVNENNDKIGIRSRSGYLIIENSLLRKGECLDLPGTQIYLKLNRS